MSYGNRGMTSLMQKNGIMMQKIGKIMRMTMMKVGLLLYMRQKGKEKERREKEKVESPKERISHQNWLLCQAK